MSKHMTFDEWFATNGYYHDTVSTLKELMRDAWEAGVVNHEPSKQPAGVDDILNPRRWTREMSDAWHKAIPDLQAAFDALRPHLHPHPAQQEVGEDELYAALESVIGHSGLLQSPAIIRRMGAALRDSGFSIVRRG